MRQRTEAADVLWLFVVETTSSQGYGGNITLYAGIAMDGTLNGISILEISETPGLSWHESGSGIDSTVSEQEGQ